MSASDADSSIFLADTDKQIQKKIGNSFSGGQDTRELHRQLGGRTNVDIPFQYLTFFLEDDDELERIKQAYESGEMESGQIKKKCTEVLQEYVRGFRERRKAVTDEIRDEFLRPRHLEFVGSPFTADGKEKVKEKEKEKGMPTGSGLSKLTKRESKEQQDQELKAKLDKLWEGV